MKRKNLGYTDAKHEKSEKLINHLNTRFANNWETQCEERAKEMHAQERQQKHCNSTERM